MLQCPSGPRLGGADAVLNAATDEVLERVRCAPDGSPAQDEAACALLRGLVGCSCEAADTTVAPYEFSHVALPPDALASRTFWTCWLSVARGVTKDDAALATDRAELDQELSSIEPFFGVASYVTTRRVQALHRRIGPN